MRSRTMGACLGSAVWIVAANGCKHTDDEAEASNLSADAGIDPSCVGLPAFHLGMTARGENDLVLAELVDAEPLHKYENAWLVKLTDLDGNALEDLELYKVQPWVPSPHNHDGIFVPIIEAERDAAGTYSVGRINMHMHGHWEVRFFAHVGDRDDEAIFDVCIPQ